MASRFVCSRDSHCVICVVDRGCVGGVFSPRPDSRPRAGESSALFTLLRRDSSYPDNALSNDCSRLDDFS